GLPHLDERKAHHRLVDAPDLLHVERSIRDALCPQHEELIEHAVDDSIADTQAAFEEGIGAWIEEAAMARREAPGAVAAASVDEAEERREARPGPEALAHRVWAARSVASQLLEESADRRAREQAALLGDQEKDEAEERREEAAVDVRRRLAYALKAA